MRHPPLVTQRRIKDDAARNWKMRHDVPEKSAINKITSYNARAAK